jgi:hypothetical protein
MVILAAYPKDQVAKSLLFIAKEHLSFWASTLRATDETTAGSNGPTIIQIAPWATGKPIDATTLRCAVDALVERGWTLTPPSEQEQDAEDRCLVSWMETALKREEEGR